MSVQLGDIALVLYVLLAVVFDDGSLAVQIGRVLLVASALGECLVKKARVGVVLGWQSIFTLFAFASVSWAASSSTALDTAFTVAVNAVSLVSFVFLVVEDPLRFRLAAGALCVAPLLLMLRVSFVYGPLAFVSSRSAGATSANVVGMVGALGLALALLSLNGYRLFGAFISAVLIIANASIVLLSASRKAVVMVVLILLLYAWLHRSLGGMTRGVRVAIVALLAGASIWGLFRIEALYQLAGYRIEGMVNAFLSGGEVDDSTETRLTLIERGLEFFSESPWFGHGGGNFFVLMERDVPRFEAQYAHNNFVELLVNFGVIGFVLYYWMYALIIQRGLRLISSMTPVRAMWLSLVIVLLVTEYGFVSYYSRIFLMFVGLAWVALCTSTLNDHRREDQSRRFGNPRK